MDDELAKELEVMQRCAEALGALAQPAQARVLHWLNESLGPKRQQPAESSPPASTRFQEHLQSQAFRRLATAQQKFLSILDLLRRLHPDPEKFLEVACTIGGRTRRYFARTREEIEECGSGAKPIRITRNYPLYVDCNNSTESKRQILRKLMAALGYDDDGETIAEAIQ
jgi:negative regulator of replication initiation